MASITFAYGILILIALTECDDKYANFKTKRDKRFFHNLNTYFGKSTEPTVEIPKTNVSRNSRPVYVFDNEYLCNHGAIEYCNHTAELGRKFETSTPLPYLTPPSPLKSDQFSKFDHSDTSINGYVYPNPNAQNGKRNPYYSQYNVHYVDTHLFRVSVNDVICIKSSRNGRFTVGIATSGSVAASPIIENGYTAENPPQCSVTTINSTAFHVNIHEPDLINCGVYYCNSETESNLMCLTLRFPLISGIKTGDDISVRIQCRPQQQLLSHVKQLQLKPSHLNVNVGRSLPLIATISNGNANQELHTDVSLYALTNTGFSQLIRNNDAVTLGEDVQLRGVVRQGYGWHYSRFGKVIVQRVLAPSSGYVYGENPDSVVVVADDGCVNSAMKSICPNAPFNDPENPLVSMLNLKMFIFNNMKDGDELTMFVTMFGCVHYEDCYTDNNICQSWSNGARVKRSDIQNSSNKSIDMTSEIKIKIITKPKNNKIIECDEKSCEEIADKRGQSFKMLSLFVCCAVSLTICVLCFHGSISLRFRKNL